MAQNRESDNPFRFGERFCAVITGSRIGQIRRPAVNNLVSVDFTKFRELTLFGHKTVGEFYNSNVGPIPLTIKVGGEGRINRTGMDLAWIQQNYGV